MEVDDAVQLIRMEYGEMPDLRLNFWQVQRLWSLSSESCEEALVTLIRSGFLFRTGAGFYVRNDDVHLSVRAVTAVMRAMRVD